MQYTQCASLHCTVHTQCLSTLCSTHTVPLYTVQYTHSASLHCAVHTQCLSTLCSTHTVPLYTMQYTHCASLHCAVHTLCLSTLYSTHTVPLYTMQYTHSASLHCAVHTQCLSTLCSTHTVPLYTVQYTHSHHREICYHNTDYVHINGHDRTITVILAKHRITLPDDGSLGVTLCMFRTVFPTIVRSSQLYIQQKEHVKQILPIVSSICLTYACCCMYSHELLTMNRKTVQNMQSVTPNKINLRHCCI